MEEVIPVVVYRAQGHLEASVVKAKLESEGIPAILSYESAGIVYGMTFDGLGEVRVMVPAPLQAAAHEALNEARFHRPDFERRPGRHSADDADEDEDEGDHGEHAEEDPNENGEDDEDDE